MRNSGILLALMMLLAGCGSAGADRAVSGGGIGAGVGTAAGILIGGPFGGFVVGSAVGAATGLVTDEEMIDLGEPVWAENRNTQETASRSVPQGKASQTTGNNGNSETNSYNTEFSILN